MQKWIDRTLGTNVETIETTEILVYQVTDPVSPVHEQAKLHVRTNVATIHMYI